MAVWVIGADPPGAADAPAVGSAVRVQGRRGRAIVPSRPSRPRLRVGGERIVPSGLSQSVRRVSARAASVRSTRLAQAAISARREAPSLARMCSTWLLAVFGAMPSCVGDLRVRAALGDQPRDRELASRQRPPRLVVRHAPAGHARRASSARSASTARLEARGGRPDLDGRAAARRRIGSIGSGSAARSSRAQVASQMRGLARPSRGPPPRGRSGRRRSRHRSSATRPRPCSSAAPATSGMPSSRSRQAASHDAASAGRPAAWQARTPVTTNGHELEPLVRGQRPCERVPAVSERALGIAGLEGHLGEPPERWQDELDRLGRVAELRVASVNSSCGRVEVAAAHRDVRRAPSAPARRRADSRGRRSPARPRGRPRPSRPLGPRDHRQWSRS